MRSLNMIAAVAGHGDDHRIEGLLAHAVSRNGGSIMTRFILQNSRLQRGG